MTKTVSPNYISFLDFALFFFGFSNDSFEPRWCVRKCAQCFYFLLRQIICITLHIGFSIGNDSRFSISCGNVYMLPTAVLFEINLLSHPNVKVPLSTKSWASKRIQLRYSGKDFPRSSRDLPIGKSISRLRKACSSHTSKKSLNQYIENRH